MRVSSPPYSPTGPAAGSSLVGFRSAWRWHGLAWALFILTQNLLSYLETASAISAARTVLTFPLAAALFYANADGLLDRFGVRRRWGPLLLGTAGLLVGFAAGRLLLYRSLLPVLGLAPGSYAALAQLTPNFLLDTAWLGAQYLLYSYGYWFARRAVQLAHQRQALQGAVFALEKTRLETEVALLRQQLNPHFLFNTFNFFYAEALEANAPRLADAILTLTTMLRGILELGQQPIYPLSQELTYLAAYLRLQRYRFGDDLHLHYAVQDEGHGAHLAVPPLLFLSLVENVFKYGELSEANAPAHVGFELCATHLVFRTANRKRDLTGRAVPGTGLGLANVRQQLAHHFPGAAHALVIEDTATAYELTLTLHFPSASAA